MAYFPPSDNLMHPPETQGETTMVHRGDYDFELEVKSEDYRLSVLLI